MTMTGGECIFLRNAMHSDVTFIGALIHWTKKLTYKVDPLVLSYKLHKPETSRNIHIYI